jgi:hypothetical protein
MPQLVLALSAQCYSAKQASLRSTSPRDPWFLTFASLEDRFEGGRGRRAGECTNTFGGAFESRGQRFKDRGGRARRGWLVPARKGELRS